MTRAHKKAAAMHGPDALDWVQAADDVETEFGCRVTLLVRPTSPETGKMQVRAVRHGDGFQVLLAVEEISYPNTRMQAFWPSAYLLLHRVTRTLANAAYKPM